MAERAYENFQIRITEESYDRIKEVLGWYLTDQRLVFRHAPNADNIHHHLYLFGLMRTAESVRKLLRKHYDKSKFAVSVTAGKSKQKITAMLAYQYASKPKSNPVLVDHAGFTDEQLKEFEDNAKEFYTPMTAVLVTKEEHYIVRPDRVWERLKLNYEKYEGKTVPEIKSMLAVDWLTNGKAILRGADAHRYALSLYYLCKYKNYAVIPDNALITEFQ